MSTFVDTSGLLAVLDTANADHPRARTAWNSLLHAIEPLITTSYVVVESCALVQARFGLEAVRTLHAVIFPLIDVIWVDADLHRSAAPALLTAQRRRLSLVDCTSFAAMRRAGIMRALAFGRHFAQPGFQPAPSLANPGAGSGAHWGWRRFEVHTGFKSRAINSRKGGWTAYGFFSPTTVGPSCTRFRSTRILVGENAHGMGLGAFPSPSSNN